MKINLKNTRRMTILLAMLMLLSVVLASCVNTDNVPEVIGTSFEPGETSHEEEDTSVEEVSTPEGYTAIPVVKDIVNITPTKIAVSGTCEEGATVYISGGAEDVSTKSKDGYFIIETDILYENNLLDITAQVEGKEMSEIGQFIARFNATADTRLDGNSVSVGVDSQLYLDKMLDDASGTNLYTESQLNKIQDYVTDTVTSYYQDRAGSQDVELIYLLIPNVTTIYPEIFPEGVVGKTNTTVYDQVLETLSKTRATVVDMRAIYENFRDDEYVAETYGGLYRGTDSSLTDYGAYLAYEQVMNIISQRFPDAAPRTLDEFEWKNVTTLGGNLVNFRELDKSVITEDIVISVPKFDISLGTNTANSASISSLKKYIDEEDGDYGLFTTISGTDELSGVAERWLIDTKRSEDEDGLKLPNAIIYRDYSTLTATDIFAERFDKCLIAKSGEHTVNLSASAQYAADGKNTVDYIIVAISEENMDTAFEIALK